MQPRLGSDATLAAEQSIGDAVIFEHRDITRTVVELLLGPEELQCPLRPLIISERQARAQRDQFVAASLGSLGPSSNEAGK